MSMKYPITPAGIEPATFRFVAQHLNHCATAVPHYWVLLKRFYIKAVELGLCTVTVACKLSLRCMSFTLIEQHTERERERIGF